MKACGLRREGKKKFLDREIYERGLSKLADDKNVFFIFMKLFYAFDELNKTNSNQIKASKLILTLRTFY